MFYLASPINITLMEIWNNQAAQVKETVRGYLTIASADESPEQTKMCRVDFRIESNVENSYYAVCGGVTTATVPVKLALLLLIDDITIYEVLRKVTQWQD